MFSRSVRDDAQKRLPHAFRIGSVIFILLLLVAAHANSADAEISAPGLNFFLYLAYLMIALITLAGMGHFANAITEEKEEGTLGLLLLANMSPLSILFGKSTNRILSAWLIFLAQFPFALLALTLGGITVLQITQVYLSLVAYLFLIANLALLVSVLCQRTGLALTVMGLLSLLLHGFVPWLDHLIGRLVVSDVVTAGGVAVRWSDNLSNFYQETSVFYEIERILDPTQTAAIVSWQFLSNLLAGCLFFLLAWACFRQIVWAPDSSEPPRGAIPSSNSRWISAIPRTWNNALLWKDFHFLAGGPFVLLAKVILLPIFIAASYHYAGWLESALGLSIDMFVRQSIVVILVVELLMYSANLFHTEKKWGTLPTLLMLPRTVGYLGYSKVLGCLLGSVPTLVALLVVIFWDPGTAQSGQALLLRWGVLIGGCIILILCQLTILCSLIVKWGALPLAIALSIVLGAVLVPAVAAVATALHEGYQGDEWVQIGPIFYVTAITSAVLQLEISRRIHWSAAH